MSRPRGCLRCRSCGERRSGSARRRRPTRPPCCASWRRQMRAPVTRMTRMTGRLRSLPDAAGGSASVLAGSSRRIRCVCSLSLLSEQNLCLVLSDVLFFRPGKSIYSSSGRSKTPIESLMRTIIRSLTGLSCWEALCIPSTFVRVCLVG